MAPADAISEHFQELQPDIADRRRSDRVLDEICSDFEELTSIASSSVPGASDGLEKDLQASICALREEIRARMNIPNH